LTAVDFESLDKVAELGASPVSEEKGTVLFSLADATNMQRPRIEPSPLFQRPPQSCPYRIQMDIADQLQQIGFFVADDRLVTVLEEVAGPMMNPVEGHRIAGQQSSHQHCKFEPSGQKQKVAMVGD
jgi:hypothetical protein